MGTQIYDIAVVGGGLIGSCLALAGAQAGLQVALIDRVPAKRRAAADFDGRAYAVALGSARLLEALGIWATLEPKAQEIREIGVGEGAGSPILAHFDPTLTEAGQMGWIVEDHDLRSALLAALDAAGVVQIAPAVTSGLEVGPGSAELELGDGSRVRARLIAAVDGRRSPLARGQGIGYVHWDYAQTGLVAAVAHELPHGGLAHQSFFPGGPFAVLPLRGERSAIVWSERVHRAAALMRLSAEGYASELARRIGPRLGRLELIGKRWAYPLSLALAERYVAPRLALLGDAAHGVHPIAGQGLNLGLRDVAALAEVTVEAARRGEDIGRGEVLARYERWRRFDGAGFALGMDALNRLFSNDWAPLSVLRQVGLAGVGACRPALRGLMTEATGQAGAVPRLLKGLAI
ncbi:MAG: UbiH/UbiF/VisC/COQ6 family ubiquinone biosynthesis hydroxylase [Pikeienuella sp.]